MKILSARKKPHYPKRGVCLRNGGLLGAADKCSGGQVRLGHLPLLVGRGSVVGGIIDLRLARVEDLCSEDQRGERGGREGDGVLTLCTPRGR